MDSKAFGINVAKKLEEIGMSQRELADKVEVTEVAMSRYISGERTPKGPIIAATAKELGTTFEELTRVEMAEKKIREMTSEEIDEILRTGLIIKCESEEVMNALLNEFHEAGVTAYRIEDEKIGEFVVEMPPVK